jgi:mRNA interferase YafQ
MRTIERSSAFKRDYKRETKGRYRATPPRRFLPEAKAEFTERTIHVFFARTGKTL